jgi:hypothetical protein
MFVSKNGIPLSAAIVQLVARQAVGNAEMNNPLPRFALQSFQSFELGLFGGEFGQKALHQGGNRRIPLGRNDPGAR